MSSPIPYNLTQQKLQQLLAAARLNRAHTDVHSDAPMYNWNQPRYFDRSQMETIAAFAKNVATTFSSSLASLGRSDCTAAAADVIQRFASDLMAEFTAQPQFCAAITTDKNEPCGFITVSVTSAYELIAKLLGDTEPHTQQQALLPLENSLLQDITAALVSSVGRSLKQAGGTQVRQTAEVAQGTPALDCAAGQDLCRITFNVNTQNVTAVLHIVLFCSTLEPLVTKIQNTAVAASSQQFQEAILNCIAPVELPITTQFASLSLRLSDILALEEGDIVVLDKAFSEPIDILLRNNLVFQAHLAADVGKYALVITEPSLQPTGK
jgi:flagellar motor switch protein FliM